jgi:glycosyltransferase involved in cell wall biosynthesis
LRPVITTVIPTYQRPKLLRRAILSALHQTYPHVRVCVYDNASGDETEEVVRQFPGAEGRIAYRCHASNLGPVNNLIHGIRDVETPFFSILSDDDLLAPGFYETVMGAFEASPKAMFAAMDSVRIDERGNLLSGPTWPLDGEKIRYCPKGEAFVQVVNGSVPAPWIGTVFRKEVRDQMGLPNPEAGPNINDNYILRAAARFPFAACRGIGCMVVENTASTGFAMGALNAEWPRWWMATIEDIENDQEVPAAVRAVARKMLRPDFRRIAFRQVIHGLGRFGPRDEAYARQAARGAAECGNRLTSAGLRSLVWSYAHVLPARWILDALVERRKSRTRRYRLDLQREYRCAVECAKRLNGTGQAD